MFDWSDLRIFLAVHRTGSFSAAARQLRINATTVGRRIEALEAALGAALFDRMPDGLRPTEAATEIRVHAESMEAQAFAIERKLGGRELAGGVVRITCSEVMGARLLTPLLSPLREHHPGLRIELGSTSRNLDLVRREADLALRLGRPVEATVVARRLATIGFAVYGTARVAGLPAEERRWVSFDDSLAHVPESEWVETARGPHPPVFRSNSTAALLEAARAGIGLGLLPCWLGEGAAELQRLGGVVLRRELWLVLHPQLRRAPLVRAVADHLTEAIEARATLLAGEAA